MPPQVRHNFIVYENQFSKVLEELMAEDSRSLASTQQYCLFEYVESLIKSLSQLCAKTNNTVLCHLLVMAMQEAQDSKNIAKQHGSACSC